MALDIKRLPKWSYYASGGVVVAALGYKVWQARGGGAETESVPADPQVTSDPTYGGTTGVVPIFTTGNQSNDTGDSSYDGSSSVQGLIDGAFGLATDALNSATGTTETIGAAFTNLNTSTIGWVGQELQSQRDNNVAILDAMRAGESPAAVQPAPIVNNYIVPAPAPVAVPANNQASKPAGYPHQNLKTGKWYKNTVATKNGTDANGNKYKKGDSLNEYSDGRIVKD